MLMIERLLLTYKWNCFFILLNGVSEFLFIYSQSGMMLNDSRLVAKQASCILCREPSHVPLRCEEVEKVFHHITSS